MRADPGGSAASERAASERAAPKPEPRAVETFSRAAFPLFLPPSPRAPCGFREAAACAGSSGPGLNSDTLGFNKPTGFARSLPPFAPLATDCAVLFLDSFGFSLDCVFPLVAFVSASLLCGLLFCASFTSACKESKQCQTPCTSQPSTGHDGRRLSLHTSTMTAAFLAAIPASMLALCDSSPPLARAKVGRSVALDMAAPAPSASPFGAAGDGDPLKPMRAR